MDTYRHRAFQTLIYALKITLLCLIPAAVPAQKAVLDSLRAVWGHTPYGSKDYIVLLSEMASCKVGIPLAENEHDSIPDWLNTVIDLAGKNGLNEELGVAYYNFGYYYWCHKQCEKAVDCFHKAAIHYEAAQKLKAAGISYYNAGIFSYNTLNSYTRAIAYLKRSIEYKDYAIGSDNAAQVYFTFNAIGDSYKKINKIDSALYFTHLAVDFSEQHHTHYLEAYTNLIYLYGAQNKFEQAMGFANHLIKRAQNQRDTSSEMWGYSSLAYLFQEFCDHKTASMYYERAAQLANLQHNEFDAFQFKVSTLFEQYADRPAKAVVDQLFQLYELNKKEYPCTLNLWSEGLGTLLAAHGQPQAALRVFDELLETGKACEDHFNYAKILSQKADFLLASGPNGAAALLMAKRALSMVDRSLAPALFHGIARVLAQAEVLYGDRAVAARLLEEGRLYNDSIQKVKFRALSQLVNQLETQKSRTALLEKENQVLYAEQQNKKMLMVLLSLVVMSIVVFLVLYTDRNRILKSTRNLTAQMNQKLSTLVGKTQEYAELLLVLPEDKAKQEQQLGRIHQTLESLSDTQLTVKKLEELESIMDQQALLSKKYKESAEQRTEDLKVFNYAVGHDLKTPLDHMKYYLGALQQYTDHLQDERIIRSLSKLKALSDESQTMIDAMLRYADADQGPLFKASVNTRQLIEKTIENSLETIAHSNITFQVADDLPSVVGDTWMLRQVFSNIIYNAIKFTQPSAHPQIRIYGQDDPRYHRILIEDNGIGIPVEKQGDIFQLFKTAHDKTIFGGHGIGLAICQRIVSRHGGAVSFQETPGGGATFVLDFPKA